MSTVFFIFMFIGIGALYLVAAWLDKRNSWQLIQWMNGKCDNPFESAHGESQNSDEDVSALKERIEVLEKIVTEPAYELNKKINAL